jgi:AAA domain
MAAAGQFRRRAQESALRNVRRRPAPLGRPQEVPADQGRLREARDGGLREGLEPVNGDVVQMHHRLPDGRYEEIMHRWSPVRATELEAADHRDLFLIEYFLHRTLTVMYGRPKCGKSYLAQAIAAAVGAGAPILGQASQEKRKVMFMALDMGQRDQIGTRTRVMAAMPGMANVWVTTVRPDADAGEWQQTARDFSDLGVGLVIIDNLRKITPLGMSITGDGADATAAFVENDVEKLVKGPGMAVLLVHHSGKPGEDGMPRNSPMGATGVEAFGRHLLRVEPGSRPDTRTVVSYGNDMELTTPEIRIEYSVGPDGPVAVPTPQAAPGLSLPGAETARRLAVIDRGTWQTQREMADALGLNPSTITRLLQAERRVLNRETGKVEGVAG